MKAVHTDIRGLRERGQDAPVQIPPEALRDQIFAACGYALALAALVVGLFAPHSGRLGLAAALVLTAALVPVNVLAIRCYARRRGSFTTRHPATLTQVQVPAAARRREP